MAFQKSAVGERLNLITGNVEPFRPVAGYTSPAKGDLVKQDTSGNGLVNVCSATDVPLGMVWSVNNGNGVLSILTFRDNDIEFEYAGTFAVGDKVVADGTNGTISIGGFTRQKVRHDNTNGVGVVIAKDAPATGIAVVRFQ